MEIFLNNFLISQIVICKLWHFFWQTHEVVQKFVDDVYFGLCSNEFLLDITYELANVFGMLGEDPGDEGYEDPYDEDGSTVQTIILPGNTDLVKKN